MGIHYHVALRGPANHAGPMRKKIKKHIQVGEKETGKEKND